MTKIQETLSRLQAMRTDMCRSQTGYSFVSTLGDVYKQIADLPIADKIVTGTVTHADRLVVTGVANVAKVIARMTETQGTMDTRDGNSMFAYTGTPVDVEAAMFLTDLTAKTISDEVKRLSAAGMLTATTTELKRLKVRTTSKELRKIVVSAIAIRAAKSRSTSRSAVAKRALLIQATA